MSQKFKKQVRMTKQGVQDLNSLPSRRKVQLTLPPEQDFQPDIDENHLCRPGCTVCGYPHYM